MGAIDLYTNLSAQSFRGALLANALGESHAGPTVNARGDYRQYRLHFLEQPGRYTTEDPTAWSKVTLAIGTADQPVDSGLWIFTDPVAAESTGTLAYNITAAALQTAIRAACTINYSTCLVADVSTGKWTIDRNVTGDIDKPTGTTNQISPRGSTLVVDEYEEGDADLSAKCELSLVAPAAALRSSGWSAFPIIPVVASVVQSGSSIANKIFKVTWNPDAIGGSVSVNFTGDTTTETVSWDFDADQAQIATEFESHPDVETDGVRVTLARAGECTIECKGDGIRRSDVPEMEEAPSTLNVPVGLVGAIEFNKAGVRSLLANSPSATTTLEIEIQRTAGQPETVAQSDCTLWRDLIRNNPGASDSLQQYPYLSDVVRWIPSVTALVGGTATDLDSISTVDMDTGTAVKVRISGASREYELTASTAATAAPGIIRPTDYASTTNEKVWFQI